MSFDNAKRTFFTVVVCGIGLVLIPDVAFGCPTCKDSLHANQSSLGFAISILFMMSMPFLILAAWLTILFKSQSQQGHLCPNSGHHSGPSSQPRSADRK